VHFWVAKLLDGGILQKDAKGFLSLTRNPRALKLAGEVCAGLPTSAEEEIRGIVSFDEYLVRNPETSFLLSVKGDSMIDAGIMEKDLVVVESKREPKNGDIVLAEVDGDWTMKYFHKKGEMVVLEAANSRYSTIIPRAELRIAGVITAVVRKYHQ
ncbi:MAG TPA: transcriptional repressor LexA, partial [Paludibacter sp.]|nr:transcriptional repressor LexA [Paludibacter sp.]